MSSLRDVRPSICGLVRAETVQAFSRKTSDFRNKEIRPGISFPFLTERLAAADFKFSSGPYEAELPI